MRIRGQATVFRLFLLLAPGLLVLPGCAAKHGLVMEMSGTVMYEKPALESIAHTLEDRRAGGGKVSLEVVLRGDPGLVASFDISPGIADHEPMREVAAGHYVARFDFPEATVGGPFAVLGRVRHDQAGEVTLRDPKPITIPLLDR